MANAAQTPRSTARLRNSTTVLLVGNIEPAMAWYKQLGFESNYYPPGFAIMRRDDVEIFLQHQPGYVRPDDPGRRKREAWNVYIVTDDVQALYEEYRANSRRGDCASIMSSGVRHDGIRRVGPERSPAGLRATDRIEVSGRGKPSRTVRHLCYIARACPIDNSYGVCRTESSS
jgi:hypothetical protein